MTRAELATYLGQWLGGYLDEVDRSPTDTPGNLQPVVDATLRALGHTGDLSEVVEDDDEGLRVWGEYLALKLIVNELGLRFNVGLSGNSFSQSQLYDHAKEALADAEVAVVALFGSTSPGAGDVVEVDLNQFAAPRCAPYGSLPTW